MRGKLLEIAKTIYVDIISRDISLSPLLTLAPVRMINYHSELGIFEYEKR